jgi:FMN phosphatase YigB (HAD superfamily)
MRYEQAIRLRIIIDYDGTLTREEHQAELLRQRSLSLLAGDILDVSLAELAAAYAETQRRILQRPERHGWKVNGQIAAYCDEGAFILNTTTMQEMLAGTPAFRRRLERRFAGGPYDPVMACVNQMFHDLTHDLPPFFREDAAPALQALLDMPGVEVVVLTNSKGDKVRRALGELGIPLLPAGERQADSRRVRILGDVRQYDMSPAWPPADAPALPAFLSAAGGRQIDLRRPVYYAALQRERSDGAWLCVVADGLSLAGSLPLALGIPFFLLKVTYTPAWVEDFVRQSATGAVLEDLLQIVEQARRLAAGEHEEAT